MNYLSLSERKQVSLNILKNFHDFCIENDLKYTLAYGSLIGAVRHKGFIPWDDDIDVCMLRKDYDRMRAIWRNTENLMLVIPEAEKDYCFTYAKLVDKNTELVDYNGNISAIGVGIDIFPMDYMSDNYEEEKVRFIQYQKKVDTILNRLFAYYVREQVKGIKKIIGIVAKKTGLLNYLAKKFSIYPSSVKSNSESKVGCLVSMHPYLFEYFDKEFFEPIICDFEEFHFYIPKNYDKILTEQYGDYMQLPPVEKQNTTHFEKFIWRKNDKRFTI